MAKWLMSASCIDSGEHLLGPHAVPSSILTYRARKIGHEVCGRE